MLLWASHQTAARSRVAVDEQRPAVHEAAANATPTHSTAPSLTLDYAETIAVLRAVQRIPHQGGDGRPEDSVLRELLSPLRLALFNHTDTIAPSREQWDRDCTAVFRCRPTREKPHVTS